jgi:hypothetical protein
MQSHLKFHGLPPEEVHQLAGSVYAITTQLTYVDGTMVPDYSKYDCLGGYTGGEIFR